MSSSLDEVLRRRAERADPAPDTDAVLARVRVRAEDLRRRRRGTVGAVSGVTVVLALVALLVVVAGGSGTPGHRREAAGTAHSSPAAAGPPPPATTRPAASGPVTSPVRTPIRPAQLVAAGHTPQKAPLAVTLLPRGWHYLGYSVATTVYGPAGVDHDATAFAGKIALLVGDRFGAPKLPRTIAGKPASLAHDPSSTYEWNVTIGWNTKILLNIQVPRSAGLNQTKVLRMANTLLVRDVTHPAHG